ncbi:MAG: hypothetical protein GY759_02250 [Chloroflexi bacterium]|nr:hypothetical protein [Chloroflexota bacterium]
MTRTRPLIVERDEADTYLLISLVSFAATVILVRLFLQLTGYPQLGSSSLHIAHLLWGGLGLFIAILLVLIFDNPRALRMAAILTGVGIGLFIDEVGKFITQNNDYFFPAAAPIIYGFFLLTVVLYLVVRKPEANDPERSIIRALEDIQEAIYGDFDTRDLELLHSRLADASEAEEPYIAQLADALHSYVEKADLPIRDREPTFVQRATTLSRTWGLRLGHRYHRLAIVAGLIIVALSAITVIAGLSWVVIAPAQTTQSYLARLAIQALSTDVTDVNLYFVRLALEAGVSVIAVLATYYLLRGNERRGSVLALAAVVLSLTAIQLLTFYLDQFTAILPTLFQFGLLLLILSYRRWYILPTKILPHATV